MLRSFKQIIEKPVQALDGEVGHIKDLVLSNDGAVACLVLDPEDDQDQAVRIDQAYFSRPQRRREISRFPVNLTSSQVKRCPDWQDEDPGELDDWISYAMTMETDRWITSPYEHGASVEGSVSEESQSPSQHALSPRASTGIEEEERSFFSAQEACGYSIQTRDDTFGRVYDFLFNDTSWMVHYLMLDSKKWLPGSRHCIHAKWLKDVDPVEKVAVLNLRRDEI